MRIELTEHSLAPGRLLPPPLMGKKAGIEAGAMLAARNHASRMCIIMRA